MKVLVTGATGFIGLHMCAALMELKHQVFALSHSRENNHLVRLPNQDYLHLVNGDIRSLSAMQDILEKNKIDTVIHEAAYINDKYQEAIEINAMGTWTVLQAASMAGCPKIIYASSRDVYGLPQYLPIDENHPKKPVTLYGLTKLHGEDYCEFYMRHHGMHAIILRYAGVYGPGKRNGAVYTFIKAMLEGKPFPISSDGHQTRDFLYVGDAVKATLETLEIIDNTTFDIFNIGSGKEISLNELAVKVIEAGGMNINYSYSPAASDDRFLLDITKAKQVLNYSPLTIENALAEYVKSVESGG